MNRGPPLPPVPHALRQEVLQYHHHPPPPPPPGLAQQPYQTYQTHHTPATPATAAPTAPLSPRPQRPQGGAVDTATAKNLEKQASLAAHHQQHQHQHQHSSMRAGSSSATATTTTMNNAPSSSSNPRVANWVATSGANNGPGFAAYVNSARGATPAPPPQFNSAGNAAASTGTPRIVQHPAPAPPANSSSYAAHPRAATSSGATAYTTSLPNTPAIGTAPNVGSSSSSSQQQQQQFNTMNGTRPLHQSFSDLNLASQAGQTAPPIPSLNAARQGRAATQSYAGTTTTSASNPNAPGSYRNSSPAGGASAGPGSNYTTAPLLPPIPTGQFQISTSTPSSRRSSLVPAGAQQPLPPIPPQQQQQQQQASLSQSSSANPSPSATATPGTSDPNLAPPPTLCIALPSQSELAQQRDQANYAPDPAQAKVTWAKNVMKFVERFQASSTPTSSGETSKITDPVLVKWTDESIRIILQYAEIQPNPVPEALYLRGELSNSGKFPSYRLKDLSLAFRDFELSANLGFTPAWAKIALAYENFGEANNSQTDFDRAKKAYEEGVMRNEVTCTYVSVARYLHSRQCTGANSYCSASQWLTYSASWASLPTRPSPSRSSDRRPPSVPSTTPFPPTSTECSSPASLTSDPP